MDSNTTSYKQIDDRGELDLERRIEELTNENLILKEQKEILELRIKYLQQQIRKYSGKENI
jgi:chaperonin cofactor prefoldin